MWVVGMALCVLCVGCGGKSPRQHYEKAGAFSYDPPAGWQAREFPGLKYRVTYGARTNEFAPNINVIDETFSGTLAAYVDANLEVMRKLFTRLTVVSRKEFKTQDGQPVIRVVTQDEQQGRALRQTLFFFSNSSRKYIATCTTLADGGEGLDSTFEKSMTSFRTH